MLLVWSLTRHRRCVLRLRPFSPVLILFLLAVFASTLFSLEPSLSLFGTYERQMGLIGVTATVLLYMLLAEALTSEKRVRALVGTMALAGSFCGVYGLLQYFRLDPLGWSDAFGDRPISTVGHPDFFGVMLAMTLPLPASLCHLSTSWFWRVCWFLAAGIQCGGLLVSQTRGAWIAASISLAGFLLAEPWLRRHRVQWERFQGRLLRSLLALTLLLCLGTSVVLLKPEFRERAASVFHWDAQARIYLWRDTLKVIEENPLLGSGPETFRVAFMPHKSIELARVEKNVNFDNPHNHYLYLWATTGSVGLAAYLYLLLECLRNGIRRIRLADTSSSTLSLGVVWSIVAYGVCMLTGIDTISTFGYLSALIAVATTDHHTSGRCETGGSMGCALWFWARVVLCASLLGLGVGDASRVLKADYLARMALTMERSHPTGAEEGKKLLGQAAALLPRESFYRLSLAERSLKNAQEAGDKERWLREALYWGQRSLEHGWAPENSYQLIGTASLRLGACDKAELNSLRGLKLDPHNFGLRTTLARALICQGRNEEALEEVERALSVDPTYTPARRLEKVLRGGVSPSLRPPVLN